MTDDFLITLQHEGYLLKVLMVTVRTAIKTGNPLLFQGAVSDWVGTTSNDAHVIAAAIRGDVDMIVTWNLKHFPEEIMDPLHIEMQDPDDFLMNQLDLDTPKVLQSVKACRERFNDPEFTPQEYITMLERQRLPNTALELRPYADVKLI